MWVFYITPVILLNVPLIQKSISKIASEQLYEALGVPVEIGRVDFELFNKLIIKDLYLEDQQGEILFQAKRLAAGFDFLPLFKGKIRFSSAQLFSFQFNLAKENDQAPLNLQFVIDAFAKKDTIKKESNIDLVIKNLNLRRGNFTFNVKDAKRTYGKFNTKHLEFNDISSKIQINKLTESELIANIERFSFKEQSGLIVRRISFGMEFSKDSALIKKFEVILPKTSVVLENIVADFKDVNNSNEYLDNTLISLKISPSKICLKDLSALVPSFENYQDLLNFEGELSGKINRLKLSNFLLTDENELLIQANAQLENLPDVDDLYLHGVVKKSFISASEITKIANNFSEKSVDFPEHILRLGNIRFEGEISGYFHHLTAYGLFNTDVGNIRTDILFGKNQTNFIKGEIKSQDLNLNKIFLDDDFGMANFDIVVDVQQNRNKKYEGIINSHIYNIELKHYTYENILLKGDFTENSFNGTLDINCPEGKLLSKGLVKLNGNQSVFNFSAQAEHIKLDKLNLTQKYKNSDLSFNIDVDCTGNDIDNLLGYIDIKDIRFGTEKGGYYIDTLTVTSKITELNDKILKIDSDLLKGSIIGQYSFQDIIPALVTTGSTFLPAIIKEPKKKINSDNNFNIDVTVNDLEQFAYILDLPFVLYGQTKIQGNYDYKINQFEFELLSPKCDFNNMLFKDCSVILKNQDNKTATMAINATNFKNEKINAIDAILNIADNSINTKLAWNDRYKPYNGIFNINTKFIEQTGIFPLKTEIDFLESKATLKDSIWNINPSQIVLDSAKIKINHLFINHADQFVKINGTVSKHPQDSVWVDLNKVDLDYIFDILSVNAFELGGIVSGHAIANDIYHTRQLSTKLSAENFSFNQAIIGKLDLLGLWDDEKQGIQLLGDIHKNDSSSMKVDGAIYPIKKALDLRFGAKNVDASFLRKYLDGVTKDFSGLVTGDINLFGNFSDVTLSGDAFIKNGSFGIDFLNTTYTFSDYVHLKSDEISLKNVTFYDKFGGTALVNGSLKHKFLDDFVFSANINANKFLAFNATERKSPSFFGTAFGTGFVSIKGNENLINFDIKLRTDEKTKVTLNFMEQNDITEYNFINFISKNEPEESYSFEKILSQFTNKPIYLNTNSGTDLKFDLQLTATPDATIEMIMDSGNGDRIKGYGQGNINIQYGTSSPLKLFGKYTLEKGVYNFSFQQALYRDFQIRDGSSISFKGDPNVANLNINAIYSLSANISDLNESLAQETSRLNVPVNCVLKIAGELERPDIKFDIEVPNSGDNLERQIKALINTDEMMNRQIIYLLVLNKFYTQESGTASSQKNNEFAAFAASTLSSQLTSLLGSFSENIQIGTVFTTNDNAFTDTEMALILSSQLLNNRLIFNGNFGYRDSPTTNTSFIGDFDLEYKLTKTGDIRLKAYNHYNDRYYSLRSAYTTQGIGLLYRKDFNNFRNLFRRKALPPFTAFPAPPFTEKNTIPSYTANDDNFIDFK